MDLQALVSSYIAAWNRRRPESLLGLLHRGATYFDAFWMEYCTGRDLDQYFTDTLREENYCYRQIGELVPFEKGVVFRYSAREPAARELGPEVYRGAEVLQIRDGLIVAISDYYCMPTEEALVEIAELTTRRHGLTRYAKSGIGASTASRFRNRLTNILDHEQEDFYPDLTVAELAQRIGCSVGQLAEVISAEFGTNFEGLLDKRRARFARKLLLHGNADPQFFDSVAMRAGYESVEQFSSSFVEVFGATPHEFCRRHHEAES